MIKPFYIVSVTQQNVSYEKNLDNYEEMIQKLQELNVDFSEVTRYYEGAKENSFQLENRSVTRRIAEKYNQNCILVVDHDNNVRLIDKFFVSTNIGKWTKIDEITDNCSVILSTGDIYTTK